MKKMLLTILSFIYVSAIFAQWATSGTNIYNTNTGNVGIGVTSPIAPLHITGASLPSLSVGVSSNMANAVSQIKSSLAVVASSSSTASLNGAVAFDFYNNGTSPSWSGALLEYFGSAMTGNQSGAPAANMAQLLFQNVSNALISTNGANLIMSPGGTPSAYFLTNGSVGIGTGSTYTYKLAVNGSAIFTQAVVKLSTNWPDYVFDKTYKLPSLKDLGDYLRINGRLPGMPSAENVKKNGLDLGNTEAKLLEKIEELTLYTIQLQQQVDQLRDEDKKLEDLQRQINELKEFKFTNQ